MKSIFDWVFKRKAPAPPPLNQSAPEPQLRKREKKAVEKLNPESIEMQSPKIDGQRVQVLSKYFANCESLQCNICLDFIVSCRTAVCGHSFCEECITECLLRKKECPGCRRDIRKWPIEKSEQIDEAVKVVCESRSAQKRVRKAQMKDDQFYVSEEDEFAKLEHRLQRHSEWKAKHVVTKCMPGQKVDVLDTEHIWCTAQIELKIQAMDQNDPIVLVHYDGWSRKYDEFLLLNSKRIAPLGCYTSRDDIPRYRMCQNRDVLMNFAHVIHNPREHQEQLVNAPQQEVPVMAAPDEEDSQGEDDYEGDESQSDVQDDLQGAHVFRENPGL